MTEKNRPLVESLISQANRLTRVAAQGTGSTIPAAVWRTLSILASEGSYRIGDLALACRVTQPTMTKLVKSLARDEMVDRVSDPHDSRASRIAITPHGTAALDAWRMELGRALAPMFDDLTVHETHILEQAIQILETRTRLPRGSNTTHPKSLTGKAN